MRAQLVRWIYQRSGCQSARGIREYLAVELEPDLRRVARHAAYYRFVQDLNKWASNRFRTADVERGRVVARVDAGNVQVARDDRCSLWVRNSESVRAMTRHPTHMKSNLLKSSRLMSNACPHTVSAI
jgi:hypothetical protein